MQTQLNLSIAGFPPFSARGCTEILRPLKQGNLKRTVNGDLVYLGSKNELKYTSEISCTDKVPPAFENLRPGVTIEADCLTILSQKFIGDGVKKSVKLSKTAVEGSVFAQTKNQEEISIIIQDGKIEFTDTPYLAEEIYIGFQPKLTMVVKDFYFSSSEWEHKTSWKLFLEEV